MATRSSISIRNEDGTYTGIYCHWDGYLECNGKILLEHYSDEAKIRELMDLGNLSSLGAKIGVKHDFDSPTSDECNAYGRDRDDEDCGCITSATRSELLNTLGQEYNYVWENGRWLVSCSLTDYAFVDLETMIRNQEKIQL
jgi:hypothetical protein